MTKYYQCDNCRKTSSEHELVWIDKEKGDPLCRHCWGFVSYAFSVCTADQPEPSLGYCDGCDELEDELHLMDGDWLCGTCKATVIAVQEDKAKAQTMGVTYGPRTETVVYGSSHRTIKDVPRESDTELLR